MLVLVGSTEESETLTDTGLFAVLWGFSSRSELEMEDDREPSRPFVVVLVGGAVVDSVVSCLLIGST